ncbi:MAG: porin [Alphaproteobacteria bacterium]|nr:MAG: porin [Alphaproteobacteria bacterium]
MKIVKSLMLGSAAGLLAMSGAQAADLPVKAKAVEYVRICSLYGAGFFYIPGTDTCIKLGGYLRVETALGTNTVYTQTRNNGLGGANNRFSNYYTARSREDLNIDTRTATEYGVVRTYFDATFSWTTTNANVAGTIGPTQNAGIAGSDTIGVYHAFIQFAGFTLGKTYSQFDAPWYNYPANNFDGLVGGGGDVTGVNQLTYTADFGNGVSAAISAQDQVAYYTSNLWNTSGATAAGIVTGAYGAQSFAGTAAPDIVGMLRVDQAWGLFQLSAAAHDNHASYYNPANETSGHPSDKWGFAVQGALSIKNIPTGPGDTLSVQAVYTDGATRYNFQSLAATTFAMYGSTGLGGAYQSLAFAGASDAVFAGASAATGTALETTRTWGFRGGYNHNWNPYWSTGLYGAYAQVMYSDAGKTLVCAGITPILTAGSTCNPDFSIGQIGMITRWTPVKNLTFSADVTYTHLDQKYSGSVNAPAVAAVAKPAAVYELKDQDSVSMLIRAQRNW